MTYLTLQKSWVFIASGLTVMSTHHLGEHSSLLLSAVPCFFRVFMMMSRTHMGKIERHWQCERSLLLIAVYTC